MKSIVISGYSNIIPDSIFKIDSERDVQFSTTQFDTREVLGKKGTRSMDKLTGLAVHCIGKIMSKLSSQRDQEADRIGIVIGSAQGSMDSITRFTYETLAHESPDYVNPALFPNTVMNCAAGQSAIWHELKGPNATISSGELSSFAAIKYAISLLNKNYADTLISGGIEELAEVNIAANKKIAEKLSVSTVFSEASAFFAIEHSDTTKKYQREILAEIKAINIGFNPALNTHHALSELIDQTMSSANVEKSDIAVVSIGGAWPQTRQVEIAAVENLLGAVYKAKLLDAYQENGNAVSCHNALQLGSVVNAIGPNENALLVAQDIKGNIGVMIVSGGDR